VPDFREVNKQRKVRSPGGLQFGFGGRSIFLEARYHYIGGPNDPTNGGVKNSNTQFIPVSIGLIF
jgi:hypothetical protein